MSCPFNWGRAEKNGESRWSRTIDPYIKSVLLYQLSYGLTYGRNGFLELTDCFSVRYQKRHEFEEFVRDRVRC